MSNSHKTYYPNMDIVRYVLSIAVIIAHINVLAGYDIAFPITSFEAVGGFFALSGFLMYPNYIRHNNLKKYTIQRAKRILPPYVFIVLLCAVIFVLISDIAPQTYYFSSEFWKYITANITFLNWLQPSLPGVFDGTEYYNSAVNGSLWTMKVEWCLYFSVPLFVICLRKIKIGKKTLALSIILLSICYRIIFTYYYDLTGNHIYEILARQIFGQLAYFYCGMLVYFWIDRLQNKTWLLLAIGAGLYYLSTLNIIAQIIFNPLAISALTLSICLYAKDIIWLRHKNNISYEMYLFHYPIIQLSVYFGLNHSHWIVELLLVMTSTVTLSFIFKKLQAAIIHR